MALRFFTPWCLGFILALPAAGQQRVVRLEGRILDDASGRPIGAARVTLAGPDGRLLKRAETDSIGAFAFTVARQEGVRISADRLGYRANTTPVLYFDERTYFEVEVRLDPEALLLAPLEVVVWGRIGESPLLDNFRRRLESGLGTYFTRFDIEKRNPFLVTDVLRAVPGLALETEGAGNRPRINFGRALGLGFGRDCPAQLWIDGRHLNPGGIDVRLDDLVTPLSVEGIEVYRGLGSVPAEFLSPDARCGVVAVWTRRGSGGTGEG